MYERSAVLYAREVGVISNLWFYEIPVLGRCGIEQSGQSITRILIGNEAVGECRGEKTLLIAEAAKQLNDYIAGGRRQFELPLDPLGTSFQKNVWRALLEIPWGEYCTYGELSVQIGRPGASRAVGNAVGANPIPVLIPCHRVLAAGDAIGGFRLGLEIKEKLLRLEQIPYRMGKSEKI